MTLRLQLIICFILLSTLAHTQCYFHNLYRYQSGGWFDAGITVVSLDNGDFLASGLSDLNSGNEAAFTIKINQCGDTIWQKAYDYSPYGGEEGSSILVANKNKIYIAGTRYSPIEGARNGYIIIINSNGDALLEDTIDLGFNDDHNSAILDHNHILTTGHYNNQTPNAGAFLAKLDSAGNVLWRQVYDTLTYYLYPTVSKTFDGGYLLSGRISLPNSNWFIIKTDSAGNLEWEKRYLSPYQTFGYHTLTRDSGYVLVGGTRISLNHESDAQIAKINAAGDTLWTKTYGIPDYDEVFKFIKQLPDGNFIAAGGKREPSNNGYYIWIVKLDEQGILIWERQYSYYGGPTHNYVEDLTISIEGDIALTGYITAVPPGHTTGNDMFILKTDSCGYLENDSIQAAFTYSIDSTGVVTFTNQSTEYCTSLWHFGDGDSTYQKSPAHQYANPGTFTITLIVRAGNSLDTTQQQVTIPATPDSCDLLTNINAAFTYSIDTFTVSFTNQSANYCTALWYFGDGDSSVLEHPIHIYADSGTYIVTLVARAGNVSDTIQKEITINSNINSTNSFQFTTKGFSIYPNPSGGNMTLEYALINQQGKFTVYDITGRLLMDITLKKNTGNKTSIDLRSLNNTVHLFKFVDGAQIIRAGRIVISK